MPHCFGSLPVGSEIDEQHIKCQPRRPRGDSRRTCRIMLSSVDSVVWEAPSDWLSKRFLYALSSSSATRISLPPLNQETYHASLETPPALTCSARQVSPVRRWSS